MKPVKKNRQAAKKTDVNQNKAAAKIPNFFKSTSKPIEEKIGVFDTSEEIDKFGNTKPIYVNLLKKRVKSYDLQDEASSQEDGAIGMDNEVQNLNSNDYRNHQKTNVERSECTGCKEWQEKYNELKKQETNVEKLDCTGSCKEWQEKYKEMKKQYTKLAIRHAEMDLKYNDLLQTKTHTVQPEQDGVVLFNDDIFTPNEVKYLQAMKLDKSTDSSFILKCLEFAYKNDLSVLRGRTLKGKPESQQFNEKCEMVQVPKKDPLTPKKVRRIVELFIERISKSKTDTVAYGERIKDANVNKLIATGILNIVKKKK